MSGQGFDSWGSIVKESTYGTNPGSGQDYFEIINDSLKATPELKPRKSLRGASVRETFLGVKKVGGDLGIEMLYEGFLEFLRGIMGGYAFAADTPVAGANTHTFTLADALESYSIEINKADTPANKVFLYTGCIFNMLAFNFSTDEILEIVASLIAQEEAPNTTESGTPSFPTFNPVLWRHSGNLTLCGETSVPFDGGSFTIDNKQSADRFLMKNTLRQPKRTDVRMITGEIITEFENLNLYDKYVGHTNGTAQLAFTSDAFIVGSTPWSTTFDFPRINLQEAVPVVEGAGVMGYTVPFMAKHSGSTDDAFKITVVSGEATL